MLRSFLFVVFVALVLNTPAQAEPPTIIASRCGETGGMENSLPALTLAATTDVDFIHLPLALTKDDQLVVYGSSSLDQLTDVHRIFPERKRDDGKYYVMDFTLNEIRQLHRVDQSMENSRIPGPSFAIATLAENLALVRYLEKRLDKVIGIAPEIVEPMLYQQNSKDISQAALTLLQKFNYLSEADRIYLASRDGDELQRIATSLMPAMKIDLQLLQLIGPLPKAGASDPSEIFTDSSGWVLSQLGVKVLSRTVAAVAIDYSRLVDSNGELLQEDYVSAAHSLGLKIYAAGLNSSNQALPPFAKNYRELLDYLRNKAGIDGLMTTSMQESLGWRTPAPTPQKE